MRHSLRGGFTGVILDRPGRTGTIRPRAVTVVALIVAKVVVLSRRRRIHAFPERNGGEEPAPSVTGAEPAA